MSFTSGSIVDIFSIEVKMGGKQQAGKIKVNLKSVPQNYYSYLEFVGRAVLKTNSGM